MQSNDLQRIQHILRYCDDIVDFMKRFGDYRQFITDRAYHNAVSMCVLQIGELAGGLSSEFREETKESMQWGLIRGMRNWIAHAYNEMDDEIIWDTISNSIPLLRKFCIEIEERENIAATEKPSVIAEIRAERERQHNNPQPGKSKNKTEPEL